MNPEQRKHIDSYGLPIGEQLLPEEIPYIEELIKRYELWRDKPFVHSTYFPNEKEFREALNTKIKELKNKIK